MKQLTPTGIPQPMRIPDNETFRINTMGSCA
jgi:hypothetical protein